MQGKRCSAGTFVSTFAPMTDSTSEVAHARAALSAPGTVLDRSLLGAVHHGLLAVSVDRPGSQSAPSSRTSAQDDMPQLAVRRRGAV